MTDEQIVSVKKSWMTLSKIDPTLLGDVFYSKLFLDNPELRPLFSKNTLSQAGKLVEMLNKIIVSLDRPLEIDKDLRHLAVRHQVYGVQPSHYDRVGHALLWTIAKALGRDFDTHTEQSWVACYTRIANTMMNAHAVGNVF